MRERYPKHSWLEAVEVTDTPRGETRKAPPAVPHIKVERDEDQAQLYDENLYLDLAPWKRRGPANVSMAALADWAVKLPHKAGQRLLLIKGGRVALLGQGPDNSEAWRKGAEGKAWPVSYECAKPCDPVLADLIKDLRTWVSSDPSAWPDVAFLLNVADTSLCEPRREGWQQGGQSDAGDGPGRKLYGKEDPEPCPAPVLSLIKEWGKVKDEDILVPHTVGMARWRPLVYFPTKKKIGVAVFRGRAYCHTKFPPYAPDVCSRTYLAHKAASSPDWAIMIDVGFVDNYTVRTTEGPQLVPARGFVPTQELARYKFTLALDGITASRRMERLLALNSPVLKQTSPWIEWYYRSLVPGTHYISFWDHHRTDILHTIKSLRQKGRYLADVAAHGQSFAYRYLSPTARMLYWRRTLTELRAVMGDMKAWVDNQELPPGDYPGAAAPKQA